MAMDPKYASLGELMIQEEQRRRHEMEYHRKQRYFEELQLHELTWLGENTSLQSEFREGPALLRQRRLLLLL